MWAMRRDQDYQDFARWVQRSQQTVNELLREPVLDGFEHVADTADDSVRPIFAHLRRNKRYQ